MEQQILESIDRKLGTIIKLLASAHVEGKNKTESIIILGGLGLDADTIAGITDSSTKVVWTRLSEAKRRNRPAPKRAKNRARSGDSA